MITLEQDQLVVAFPDVHPAATIRIEFQRTLRIPDDQRTYPLPPGLGRFPLRHVDDHAQRLPIPWREHGGVFLPMYQAEALWIYFDSDWDEQRQTAYPFAVKVATGKINAVTGEEWKTGLNQDPQDYLVAPVQPWLDGYCIGEGVIRQFVAMPLGEGYTAEEQLTGAAEHGGLQLVAYPMKGDAFERRFPKRRYRPSTSPAFERAACAAPMGLAPGGRMKQEIYKDPYGLADWDLRESSRCFVHIANSLTWQAITGENPPTRPWTAQEYTKAGLPWFDYYAADQKALAGATAFQGLKSVREKGAEKGETPLPENTPVHPEKVIIIQGKPKGVVREGSF